MKAQIKKTQHEIYKIYDENEIQGLFWFIFIHSLSPLHNLYPKMKEGKQQSPELTIVVKIETILNAM